MNQINPEDYRLQIEEEILNIIEEKLVNRDMKAETAQNIANLVLDTLHPHMTIEEIKRVVNDYDQYFQELTDLVVLINWDDQDGSNQKVRQKVQFLINTGKLKES
ncbi:hypothetical protein A2X44_03715 [candidate division CPR3 bacterium GWF2_35_18]|uniref:Uncharacterized protein n=1 Tax=candidate division CPR3 bacterium GW2011_GWF2_35_18 TaxID=1618350 RepID=A0A0G0E323_UNCC3|nr:MAG: hypothetical protein UR67_C0004G0032 [candidate division CPR3 bacterium GW2011_GWF2_35_18]KKP85479.1 MAG: hypothetical protein UR87_C0049G0007 [candidate division CPR3 bacterium GW2011_GWE2_35_7]OGB63119.1 MAG: hypothetical protein A2X44_03715 [candidate division CPR3 bacterium GWF2_35_18]OGB64067.1 MAG: hypothetical protein A2250_04675 [candidate division CPR3 bacterium RIFOXYA2_FULL_35_13]OGB75632.1 MAG: hypothetical protein A2476_01800 [candidate division CPR3 bacterium RIFOXYC2_FULL